jgi:predicted O-methyltransferase YrrM
MSENDARVTQRHYDYLSARTRGDDQFLKDLKAAAKEAGIPTIAIGAAQASFMQIVLKLKGAKQVIEVGTLAGYSAIQMARALPADGLVITIEYLPKHADFAEAWVAKSDVKGKVKVLRGKGADVLKTLPAQSADACFLDADKDNYPVYLDECMRILRPGGLVMADNAFAFGQLFEEAPKDREVAGVRRFNDYIAAKKNIHAIITPLGDGCWVGVME